MFNSEDQVQAAVDDLLDAPREPGHENLKAARLSGVKELYMMLTGDRSLYGGSMPSECSWRLRPTFPGLVKNAMNKIVANQWALLGAAGYDWWMRITQQEHFETLNTITGTLVGTVGSLPEVEEGGVYRAEDWRQPRNGRFHQVRRLYPADPGADRPGQYSQAAQYPRELAKAGMRRISSLVAEVFTTRERARANHGGYWGAVQCNRGHHCRRSCQLLTTALSAAQWEVVSTRGLQPTLLIAKRDRLYRDRC
jgi:hypothetical protein